MEQLRPLGGEAIGHLQEGHWGCFWWIKSRVVSGDIEWSPRWFLSSDTQVKIRSYTWKLGCDWLQTEHVTSLSERTRRDVGRVGRNAAAGRRQREGSERQRAQVLAPSVHSRRDARHAGRRGAGAPPQGDLLLLVATTGV